MRRRVVGSVIAVLAAVVVVVVVLGPGTWWMLDLDSQHVSENDRQQLVETRKILLQTLGGAVVVAGLAVTVRTYFLSRESQVTTRFGQAVELLGSERNDVRVGAIFALERLVADSPRDEQTIIEILRTYVQDRVPTVGAGATLRGTGADDETLPSDVRAALLVLTRAPVKGRLSLTAARLPAVRLPGARADNADLSLSVFARADLSRGSLRFANLSRCDFSSTSLEHARLDGAHLIRANLSHTNLSGAQLDGASLIEATAPGLVGTRARLRYCDLYAADLRGAVLDAADLTGASLSSADLRKATLTGASLNNVDLIDADLRGTDLSGATGLVKDQFDSATTDENTVLPDRFRQVDPSPLIVADGEQP